MQLAGLRGAQDAADARTATQVTLSLSGNQEQFYSEEQGLRHIENSLRKKHKNLVMRRAHIIHGHDAVMVLYQDLVGSSSKARSTRQSITEPHHPTFLPEPPPQC